MSNSLFRLRQKSSSWPVKLIDQFQIGEAKEMVNCQGWQYRILITEGMEMEQHRNYLCSRRRGAEVLLQQSHSCRNESIAAEFSLDESRARFNESMAALVLIELWQKQMAA